jgi:hypothetical protein
MPPTINLNSPRIENRLLVSNVFWYSKEEPEHVEKIFDIFAQFLQLNAHLDVPKEQKNSEESGNSEEESENKKTSRIPRVTFLKKIIQEIHRKNFTLHHCWKRVSNHQRDQCL